MNRSSLLSSSFLLWSLIITMLPHFVYSYCIYNKMLDSSQLAMQQTSGARSGVSEGRIFKKNHVHVGDKECCPYDNYMCSKEKDRNYPVAFWISASTDNGITYGDRHEVGCPAGGYIRVTGTRNQMTFESFDVNHNRV